MAVITNIIPPQADELIRDRIGAILKDELTNQMLMYNTDATINSIWVDRVMPFDPAELPAVNVSTPKGDYENWNQGSKDGVFTIFIDVHTQAPADGIATNGDVLANFAMKRLLGVCQYILSDPQYKTLGFVAGAFIQWVRIMGYDVRPHYVDENGRAMSTLNSSMGRLVITVKANQNNVLINPPLLTSSVTSVQLVQTNKGYKYDYEKPSGAILFGAVSQYIDGTISGNEFVDKSGNSLNLTINNNDITTNGFPYKSGATVSQKVTSYGLIPDPTNFWFTNGTPNQIPVNCFFQNIDFVNQIFCKHQAQVLDINGAEIAEPKVLEIVTYTAPVTSDNLSGANAYFSAPIAPVANTIWVNAKTGNDTAGTGLIGFPVATVVKAMTMTGTDIYVQSGNYNTNSTFITATKNITGTGFVTVVNQHTGSYCFLSTSSVTLKGLIIDQQSNSLSYVSFFSGANSFTLDKIYSSVGKYFAFASAGTGTLTVQNSVIIVSGIQLQETISSTIRNIVFKGNYVNDSIANRLFAQTSANGTLSTNITYNKIIAPALTTLYFTTVDHVGLNISYNSLNLATANSTIIVSTGLNYPLNFTYNTGTIGYINITGGTGTVTVNNNNINNNTNNHMLLIASRSVVYSNNILSVAGLGAFLSMTTTVPVTLSMNGNKMVSTGDGGAIETGNGTDLSDGITGTYKYNYLEFTKANPANIHGLQVYNSNNFEVAYNYTKNVTLPYIFKGDSHNFNSSSIHHNLYVNGRIVLKGVENVLVYNNTCYNDGISQDTPCIYLLLNVTGTSNNNIIKNNIFYNNNLSTSGYSLFYVEESITFVSDNNIFYNPSGMRIGFINGTYYSSLANWQSTIHDLLSKIQNPAFVNVAEGLYPSVPITDCDNTLTSPYNIGLDVASKFFVGDFTKTPIIINKNQPSTFQNGAYIQ